MNDLLVFYLIVSILALVVAIMTLPTMIARRKKELEEKKG